jgi:hypothetical protein
MSLSEGASRSVAVDLIVGTWDMAVDWIGVVILVIVSYCFLRLVGRLVGWLVGWSVGWLIG